MKIHGSEERGGAEAEREASGLEKEQGKRNLNRVKANRESKILMIRHKAMKRSVNKMQKRNSREGSQRRAKEQEKAKDVKDGATDQPVALEEDCSHTQGGLLLYLFVGLLMVH